MALGLWPISLAVVGGVLVWTGINDPAGGPMQVARDLIGGKRPTPGAPVKVLPAGGEPAGGTSTPIPGAVGGVGAELGNATGGAAKGVAIANLAMTFKGAKYVWGGTSKNGIDCSGLVLVCYRQVAGIKMAHDATSQTRKGKIIPRSQCRAGDLVAWGSPVRYPHIAIAINNKQCMGAWTFGVPAGLGAIDQRMYNGGPTIFRVPM